ncbi:MAG: VWA domain-containing protein [Thermoanaerobaculia bacterium]
MRKRVVLTVVWALAAALPLEAAKKGVAETASVVVIEVPVTVLADGKPVRGLKAEDFEVLDGRTAQPIVGFDVIDLGERATSRGPLPTAGRRHFLFLFDLTFAQPSAVLKAREAVRDLLAHDLHRDDLAAVATYSVKQGPRVLLGFTPDRSQLLMAVDTLGDPQLAKRLADPLGLTFGDKRSYQAGAAPRLDRETVGGSDVHDELGQVEQVNRRDQQFQVSSMTRQMADLARLLGSVEGRKYVVLLSEGFDESLLVGTGGSNDAGPRGIASVDNNSSDPSVGLNEPSTTDSIASGASYNVNSDTLYGSGQVQNDLTKMITEFQRADCVIQAVDIGGLRADGGVRTGRSGQNSLTTMAKDTGGQVFRNFNDASQAMQQMLATTSVSYLLAIQPPNLARDRKYHRLKVRLKRDVKGAELTYRPGFYAPVPVTEQSPLERQLRTASDLLGEESGTLGGTLWAGPFRMGGPTAYVPLVLEVDGKRLLEGLTGDVVPVEIYAYALDNEGTVFDFFTQNLGLDLKQARPQLEQTGFKYFGHLDLPPGDFEVRLFVRNLKTGQSSLSVVPVAVPDFSQKTTYLGPPVAPQTSPWVVAREEPARQKDVPYPFMLGENPFLPAARPRLPSAGESQVAVPSTFLGKGQLGVEVRLFSTDGKPVPGIEASTVERLVASDSEDATLLVHLKTSGVAAGRYRLVLKVTHAASGQSWESAGLVEVG